MTLRFDRRALLTATPTILGTFLLDPAGRAVAQPAEAKSGTLPSNYPAQEASVVQEVVRVSHFSLERLRSLVDDRPELAKSAWDWGFGDWESALGAASHTGNHEIAAYLIDNGARPDIFTAAMMGNLRAVRAFVEATPGIQSHPGPHGITLRRHAELGGDAAKAVLAYLDELGDADVTATNVPLQIDRQAYVGHYRFGAGDNDRFEVAVSQYELLTIQRGDSTPRTLFHQGNHVFHPAGAPSARVRFRVEGKRVGALVISNPGPIVTATRIDP